MISKILPAIVLIIFLQEGVSYGAFTAERVDTTTVVKSADKLKGQDKLKELPEPEKLSWNKCKKLGDALFEIGSIYNGLKYYEAALAKNPSATYLNQLLADGNFALRDYRNASKYYKALVDLDTTHKQSLYSMYQLALTYKYLGNYEKAKLAFEEFNAASKGIEEVKDLRTSAAREEQGCDLGITLRDDKTFHEIKASHLDKSINQPFTDYAPLMKDDNTLYFSSWISDSVILRGKREKYSVFSRIYSSKRTGTTNNTVWSKAEPVAGDVNTLNYHIGNSTFTANGKTMYYTQCEQDDRQNMRCDIYKSILGDSGWVAGIVLDGNINQSGATTTEPYLGKNERGEDVLYFVSDRNKSRGLDLFAAKLNADGSFEKARELTGINTSGNELTPFYDLQTNTLYFSSDGYVTIGGYDVFKTKNNNGQWSAPEHMGIPINSSVDDMYFTWNAKEEYGFVVSNRPGGFGLKSETCCDDIYQVFRKKIYLAVKGTLLNGDTAGQLITNQPIALLDAETGTPVKVYQSVNGSYFFDLLPDKQYKLSAIKEGYFAAVQPFSTVGRENSDTLTFALSLKKMEKNKAYTLNNIYYEFDKADLTPASKLVLDTLYDILKENPQIVIELSSHTDSKGSDKYNLDLSQKRAESCVNYLINDKGVAKERVTAKGYGETQPVAPNNKPDGSDDEEGRAKNRRTEFKIIN
jgi:outer membrane protein OmpA-like peptidoglycan-associated protein